MELEFYHGFYGRMRSILDDYFGGVDALEAFNGSLRPYWCREDGRMDDAFLKEVDIDGWMVVHRSNDAGHEEEVCVFVLGREVKEDGTFGERYTYVEDDEDDRVDAPHRLVETFIALCRYRGLLGMNLVRDIRRISAMEFSECKLVDVVKNTVSFEFCHD
jgi:hypothetical protein